jgi:hypothetical protein
MKPLLTSLVERSVRNAVRDEPLPPRSADALDERGPGSAGLSTSPRGVVRPRLRSRHEPRPDSGRFDIAAIEDMIDRSPSRASDAFEPEMPQSQPDANARPGDDVRHAPVHRGRSPRRDIAVPGRGIERRPEPRADADALPQAEAAPISDHARTEPPRRDAALPSVPRPAVPERLAPPQAIREDWTGHTASEPASIAAQPIARDMGPSGPIGPPRPARPVTATSRPRTEPMTETHATPQSAPERDGALRPRHGASRGADASARPAAMERPSAPRVEITIGRVEVRAVYAPPPAERKTAARPMTSLDDYLKQRDKAG